MPLAKEKFKYLGPACVNNRKHNITNIVIASAVLSLFNSSSTELSDEKASVKFLDCTIGNSSSCHKGHHRCRKSGKLGWVIEIVKAWFHYTWPYNITKDKQADY